MVPPLLALLKMKKHSTVGYMTALPLLTKNQDGVLSYEEMLKELQCLRVFETDFGIDVKTDPDEVAGSLLLLFSQFDRDSNGVLDFEEFKTATKRMMLAVADGLGLLPLQMILEEGSFLKKAVEWGIHQTGGPNLILDSWFP
ncbi:hypothetical protein CK203_065394 [Vitis vinifera]|uniref:EF-hand domain-containing protein n=1 Tax=Vitis vinifera TaxID=29760 RepID=A0A438FNS4_VITVI|nr:hypothetical protein CK203_065394 [Vitis vinifera]